MNTSEHDTSNMSVIDRINTAFRANQSAIAADPKRAKSYATAAHDLTLAIAEVKRYEPAKNVFEINYRPLHTQLTNINRYDQIHDPSFNAISRRGMRNVMIGQVALKETLADPIIGQSLENALRSKGLLNAVEPFKEPTLRQHVKNEWILRTKDAVDTDLETIEAQQKAAKLFQNNDDPFAIIGRTAKPATSPSYS